MPRKKERKKLAVIDFETDPFKHGRIPKPFAAAFFDGEIYREFWGKNCASYLMDFIDTLDGEYIIYAHNGGKFDFFYLLDYLDNPLKIINGRIVKAGIKETNHELRDSYAIIPVPLAAYQKDEIDYSLFEEDKREKYKNEILHYLAGDCEYLFKLVSVFVERFGTKLTIGGTAIAKLRELHPFVSGNKAHDDKFRPFYFGGRVQAFETGELNGKFKVFDVNSMYPAVMKNCEHPTGRWYAMNCDGKITKEGNLKNFGTRPYFAQIIAHNKGALPVRTKQGLDFTVKYGEFFATSHEIKVALKYNLIKIERVIVAYIPQNTINFSNYVDIYGDEKVKAKLAGDKIAEIFAKLLLNSAYGKFGQNPDTYFDYRIIKDVSEFTREEFEAFDLFEIHGDYQIWRKPANASSYFDVATAASITGASRAVLLEALALSKRPIYCDTDSIICSDFFGDIDPSRIGAWKLEAEPTRLAIAGKKLYAGWEGEKVVKLATKGARLTSQQILEVVKGGAVEWANDAPAFSLSHETNFVKRKISRKKIDDVKFGV